MGQPFANLAQYLFALAVGQRIIEGDEIGLFVQMFEAGPGRGKPLNAVVRILTQTMHE